MSSELLKLWLDFGKWALGTFVLGVATVWVNYDYQNAQLAIEKEQTEAEAVRQDTKLKHEIDLAKLEQQRVFLESFVDHAMSKDLLTRIRLAHYMKTTATDEALVTAWNDFYKDLITLCEGQQETSVEADSDPIAQIHDRGTPTIDDHSKCVIGGTREIVAHESGDPIIRDLQTVLQSFGFNPGPIDGRRVGTNLAIAAFLDTVQVRADAQGISVRDFSDLFVDMANGIDISAQNPNGIRNIAIERALKGLGHDPGPIDGVIDDATKTAIAAWNAGTPLPVDTAQQREDLLGKLRAQEAAAGGG